MRPLPLLSAVTVSASLAWTGPAAAQPAEAPLARLQGCWQADGTVQGKAVRNSLRVEPVLGGAFSQFHLHGLDPADPYDALVTLGAWDGKLRGFWADSFGPDYAIQGDGRIDGEALVVDYPYPDGTFRNRIAPEGNGWRWTIVALDDDQSEDFASYALTPMPCPPGEAQAPTSHPN